MTKRSINPAALTRPIAPYSWATQDDHLVFVAGHAALDADGNVVGRGDIRAQTERTLENMKRTLEAAGGNLSDLVKTTVYLVDVSDYAGMNDVYRRYFPTDPPARATVLVGLVVAGLLVEIDGYAVIAK
ncbi:MAG: RidA family protein [Actinomycetota bacterium]|nr:RidA family protein [Actinomycetota bacterium]